MTAALITATLILSLAAIVAMCNWFFGSIHDGRTPRDNSEREQRRRAFTAAAVHRRRW